MTISVDYTNWYYARRRIYRITDNYLAFYLGPLMRFRAEIERDAVEHPDTQTRAVTATDIFTA